MFNDPLFKKSGSWEISTSNMSHDAYEGFGFGQVIPHGIGCGYMIKPEKVSFNCTTRRDKTDGSPEKMCTMLSEVLLEMQKLAAAAGDAPAPPKPEEEKKEEAPAEAPPVPEEEKKDEEQPAEAME